MQKVTISQALTLAEFGYEDVFCVLHYNTITGSYQDFPSSATVCLPNVSQALAWIRKVGNYKYSIIPEVFSDTINWSVYNVEKGKSYSMEQTEFDILETLISDYEKRLREH